MNTLKTKLTALFSGTDPRYRPRPTVKEAIANPRLLLRESLAGLVVALALIPEAISFSILAGVDPRVGLFSSFVMAITTAILGGRPAMISAATGAVALVIAPVARDYGLDYFLATVILAGIFQLVLGALGAAKLMRFIPRSVMLGFVNALAILIFMAQLPHLIGVPFAVYWLVAIGLLVMIFMPRFTKVIPAPLVAIVLVSAMVLVMAISVPRVGDEGELPESLPELLIPNVPLTMETFNIIAPFALAMALVGLLESLMTAKLVDEITDTHSQKTRESLAQGVGNILSGFLGGMGGCAMIGQTMINVKASGASTTYSMNSIIEGNSGRVVLEAGDRIIVNQSAFVGKSVTMLGQVARQGPMAFPVSGKLDLVAAIAMAGGLTDLANERKVTVNRKGKITELDYREISQRGDRPFMLQPDDIVTVAERRF